MSVPNLMASLLLSVLSGLLSPAAMAADTQPIHSPSQGDTLIEPLVNMEFVYIPPGRFAMGSPADEKNRYDDERQHEVSIDKGFWMGKYEVTFDQYDAFSKAARYATANDNSWGRGQHPVINIRWFDAAAFAAWLSKETGHRYRLPTEAEWEYAARAGTTTAFSFGNSEDDAKEYAWNGKDADERTHPIGLKKPNPWGLYDIHGNVWEWTGSAYSKEYDGSELRSSDFKSKKERAVTRGGAWYFFPKGMRSADRRLYPAGFRLTYIGFRLVREE